MGLRDFSVYKRRAQKSIDPDYALWNNSPPALSADIFLSTLCNSKRDAAEIALLVDAIRCRNSSRSPDSNRDAPLRVAFRVKATRHWYYFESKWHATASNFLRQRHAAATSTVDKSALQWPLQYLLLFRVNSTLRPLTHTNWLYMSAILLE